MTLPTIDGLHYVGCHCNDPCTCLDIECVHEQCICDRLSTAYQRGREDERAEKPPVVLSFRRPITNKQYRRIVAAIAAARGDGEQA